MNAGIEFAREAKAKVTWFTAVPEYQLPTRAAIMAHPRTAIMAHQEALTPEEHAHRSREKAEAIFAGVIGRARAAGIEFDTDFAQSDRPYEAIIDAAKRHGCDLIFMASHGRSGLSALVHASETRGVLTHSNIPTMVYR